MHDTNRAVPNPSDVQAFQNSVSVIFSRSCMLYAYDGCQVQLFIPSDIWGSYYDSIAFNGAQYHNQNTEHDANFPPFILLIYKSELM